MGAPDQSSISHVVCVELPIERECAVQEQASVRTICGCTRSRKGASATHLLPACALRRSTAGHACQPPAATAGRCTSNAVLLMITQASQPGQCCHSLTA